MRQLLYLSALLIVLPLYFSNTSGILTAKAPGDIIIGGLFPIHEGVTKKSGTKASEWTCNRLSAGRLAQSLIMVYAIEEANKKRELGNITLGYHIVDSCGEVTVALMNTQAFMSKTRNIDAEGSLPPVLAVIGGYYSEICVAVTRQLNLEHIPEISYGATSGLLSDKNKFPSFMRTVPEDDHQAQAIIEILKIHDWTWVGLLTTDGEYGRYAMERMRAHAEKAGICFAYAFVLPESLTDNRLMHSINEAVNKIVKETNVSVIVSFAKKNHMMYIFDELLKNNEGKGKVWVASDNWSQSTSVLNTTKWKLDDVGTVLGITLKSSPTDKFRKFIEELNVKQHKNNDFLQLFLNSTGSEEAGKKQIIDMTYPYGMFSIKLAVRAIAEAVRHLCVTNKCNPSTLDPHKFTNALRNTSFLLRHKKYSFDNRGDLDSGYDVILWRYNSGGTLDMMNIIGSYDIAEGKLDFNKHRKDILEHTKNVRSTCSESCKPGTSIKREEGQPVCCYQCANCSRDHFSNDTDSEWCHSCDTTTHYSDEGSTECVNKTVEYLDWNDQYHKVLLCFSAFGALLVFIVGVIYVVHWKTPVVRSSVPLISMLLLVSLLCTFGSVPFFGGKPQSWQCMTRQVFFGLSFTLCVSCILVKSFKIIMAFEFDPITQGTMEKLYKPFLIIPICLLGQVVICVVWLVKDPPKNSWKIEDKLRLNYCDEELIPAFGAMLAYISLLAIICFCVAFKGRKLPKTHKEARFITFAMLIYFIVWIIFFPVYVNVDGKYLPAVEMVVILMSAYGILFCLFFPKCYVILFRKRKNTKDSFSRQIHDYTHKDDEDDDGDTQKPLEKGSTKKCDHEGSFFPSSNNSTVFSNSALVKKNFFSQIGPNPLTMIPVYPQPAP